jgi:hypothetical protein
MLGVLLFILFFFGYKTNTLESFNNNLDSLINKEVHLTYNNDYLTMISKLDCKSLKEDNKFNCLYNVAILQTKPTEETKFRLINVIGRNNVFRLSNVKDNYNYMSQNMNSLKEQLQNDVKDIPLCFDGGTDKEIEILLEEDNTSKNKYRILYMINNKRYYISICKEKSCNDSDDNDKHLCLTTNKNDSIIFDIMIIPSINNIDNVMESEPMIGKCNVDNEVDLSDYLKVDMDDLISLHTEDSNNYGLHDHDSMKTNSGNSGIYS